MLKVVIILILIGYVFYRITNFIFSGLFRGFNQNQHQGQQQNRYAGGPRRAPNSNLNIDNIPPGGSKKGDHYSGGEYVDYEEVK